MTLKDSAYAIPARAPSSAARPRIHHDVAVGPEAPEDPGEVPAQGEVVFDVTVPVAQPDELGGADRTPGTFAFPPSGLRQPLPRLRDVSDPGGSVGDHAKRDL